MTKFTYFVRVHTNPFLNFKIECFFTCIKESDADLIMYLKLNEKTFIIKILLIKKQENTKNILNSKWFMQLYMRKKFFEGKSQKK